MSFHCQTVAFKSYDGSAQNADKENFRFSLTLQAWGYDPAKLLFYFLSQMSKQKSSDLAWEDRAAPSSAAALSSCKIFWVSHTSFALEVFLATQVSLISEGSGARCKFLYDWWVIEFCPPSTRATSLVEVMPYWLVRVGSLPMATYQPVRKPPY